MTEKDIRAIGEEQRRLFRLRSEAGNLLLGAYLADDCKTITAEEAERIIAALKPLLAVRAERQRKKGP